jgi:hypothetical protein
MQRKSKYDQEKLVGILLRKITGVIVRTYRKKSLPKIFQHTDGKLHEIDKNCEYWNDEINRYFSDKDPVEKKIKKMLIDILIVYQKKRIDPDKQESWKMLMRRYLPTQFYKKFEPMGQVPKIASLDISIPPDDKKESRDVTDVEW